MAMISSTVTAPGSTTAKQSSKDKTHNSHTSSNDTTHNSHHPSIRHLNCFIDCPRAHY